MTQLEALKKYLDRHESITQLKATVDLGILRLSERIRELESLYGYEFYRKSVKVDTRYGKSRVVEYCLLDTKE
jgi:hypothetical protein